MCRVCSGSDTFSTLSGPIHTNLTLFINTILREADTEDGTAWSACLVSLPGEVEALEDSLDSAIGDQDVLALRAGSILSNLSHAVVVFGADVATTVCPSLVDNIEFLTIEALAAGIYPTNSSSSSRMAKISSSRNPGHEIAPIVPKSCCGFLCLGCYSWKTCLCSSTYFCNSGGNGFYVGGCLKNFSQLCTYCTC